MRNGRNLMEYVFVTYCIIHHSPSQMSQKRAADGDAGQYGQQGPPAYYDANKRLRY